MKLNGLHLLLTYQCTQECDHCFVWGSPRQTGTMTLRAVRDILRQADETGGIEWIFFEGGEPFLYYPVLLVGVKEASSMGFRVGLVSNAYWATSEEDALEWLRPFAGLIEDLSISSDLFHFSEMLSQQAMNAAAAAERLDIPRGVISIARPGASDSDAAVGQLPDGDSAVMYRGRAAEKLVEDAPRRPWDSFTQCPHEDLREPGRVHIDPLGNVHICQGISIGNMFRTPLREICRTYDPASHPITGPLLEGGPAELVRRYDLPHEETVADACHLCSQACRGLRDRFPEVLTPDQMYGVPAD